MDSVAMVASRASTEALKEPRGFIKFIQIGLAIFAFATTTAYVGSTQFKVECNPVATQLVNIPFSYPYQLDQFSIPTNTCSSNSSNLKPIYGNYKAASEFYVFVGVTAFLYSLGILIFYVFADDLYRSKDIVPMFDFVVTAVYVALWLIASAAWADGVQKIKHYTKPDILWNDDYVCECKLPSSADCQKATCSTTNGGNYATLNVSIIFGFLCMAVWAGNLWFLYKETKWFKPPAGDAEGVTTSQASSPGGI